MASLLLPRTSNFLRTTRSTRVPLAPANRAPRSTEAPFLHPSTSHRITAMALSNCMAMRNCCSGREGRRAQRQAWTQYGDEEYHPETRQTGIAYSTPNVSGHLRKVYTLVGIAAGSAALGGVVSAALAISPGVAMMAGIGTLAPLLGTIAMSKEKVLWRQNLLLCASALVGIGIGPMLAAASTPTILLALGGTAAIFAGFTLAARKAPSASHVKYSGVTMGAVVAFLGTTLLSMSGGALGFSAPIIAALSSFSLYGGLAIFSPLIALDTQLMMDRAAAGDTDHVSDALNLLIDVCVIFAILL